MIKTTTNLLLGLFLAGCTYNNAPHTSWSQTTPVVKEIIHVIDQRVVQTTIDNMAVASEKKLETALAKDCLAYTPLEVPALVKLNIVESRKVSYERSMEMLGENIEAIHKQISEFRKYSKRHHQDWRKRCDR